MGKTMSGTSAKLETRETLNVGPGGVGGLSQLVLHFCRLGLMTGSHFRYVFL